MQSSILRQPSSGMTVSVTIQVPASTQAPTGADESTKTPFPSAYRRVKEFLKSLLKKRLQAATQDPESTSHLAIHQYSSHQTVAEAFRDQFFAYACCEYPFSEGDTEVRANGNPLEWWRSLERHPKADILAVSELGHYCLCKLRMLILI